jgi:glycosyltransferase involved in cell wall biosynthesis
LAVDETFVPRECQNATVVEQVLRSFNAPEQFVLYAGRLNARKNIATLVRAMALVETAGLQLLVAGAPDGLPADVANVGDRVRVLGAVSDAELRVLYAAATVFCFPSIDEGFGLCPLEAMASGTPAIVSNAPALVETCAGAAVCVDATDAAALARAIDALVADAPRRDALRSAGLARAHSFSWRHTAERLLESVHTAVEHRHVARA